MEADKKGQTPDGDILFLIGGRGAGKSTVGQAVARALGWAFVDTDALVEQTAGCTIAALVERHGWPHFREMEQKALREASCGRCVVVATGGGMVLHPDNRRHMRQTGKVAWLKAEAPILAARIREKEGWASRPSLTGASPEAEMEKVLAERAPLYADAATIVLDASRPVEELVVALCQHGKTA